jgi:hypothetical protein
MPQKTHVIVDWEVRLVDWIMHEDKAWLVPDWLVSPDDRSMRPLRIISLKMAAGYEGYKLGEAPLVWFRSNSIPKSLFENGVVPPEQEKVFVIREMPEIWLPNPEHSH